MTIEFCDFGAWGATALVAEYDAEHDVVRVNARAMARVRERLGAAAACRFLVCAVAHERHHRTHPRASESEAHAAAAAACGVEPRIFEAALR